MPRSAAPAPVSGVPNRRPSKATSIFTSKISGAPVRYSMPGRLGPMQRLLPFADAGGRSRRHPSRWTLCLNRYASNSKTLLPPCRGNGSGRLLELFPDLEELIDDRVVDQRAYEAAVAAGAAAEQVGQRIRRLGREQERADRRLARAGDEKRPGPRSCSRWSF